MKQEKLQIFLRIAVLFLTIQFEVYAQTEFSESSHTFSYKAAVVNDTINAIFFAKKGKRGITLNLIIHDSRNGQLIKNLRIPGESMGLVSDVLAVGDTLILAYVTSGYVSSKLCVFDLKSDSVINELVFERFDISDLELKGSYLSIIGTRMGAKRNETTEVITYSLSNLGVPFSRFYLKGYHGMGVAIQGVHDMKFISLDRDSSYYVITFRGKDTSLVLHSWEGFNSLDLSEEYINLNSEGFAKILSVQKFEDRIYIVKETEDKYFVLFELQGSSMGYDEIELYRSKKLFKMLFCHGEDIYLFSSESGAFKLMENNEIVPLMNNQKKLYIDFINTGLISDSSGFVYYRLFVNETESSKYMQLGFMKLF